MNDDPRLRFKKDQLIIDDPAVSDQDRRAAQLRQMFWQARYQPVRHSDQPADTFLALWANLQLYTASRRWSIPKKQIRKELNRVFENPQLQTALQAAGSESQNMMLSELKDSAVLYFTTCQKDTNYSSVLFNLIKMKDDQVASKAANGAAEGILLPLMLVEDLAWRDEMVEAVCSAYTEVFSEQADYLDQKIAGLKLPIVEEISRIRAKFSNIRNC
ncbi:MAG TPA: hypothetical protein DCM45_00480 [Clostridiales bacterium]|nr:hypothetical protein [Clostridiales bacterium]